MHGGQDPDAPCQGGPLTPAALPPTAYADFFLPLLHRCPSAMGIKNKDGETPGQILGWGPPGDSAEEEEEDEASEEYQWRQKLQGELEDEWQEVTGRLEGKESVPPQLPLPAAALPAPRLPCVPHAARFSCPVTFSWPLPTTPVSLPNRL